MERDNSRTVHLPFAGITLFRFNGFNLSNTCLGEAPREIIRECFCNAIAAVVSAVQVCDATIAGWAAEAGLTKKITATYAIIAAK